MNYTDYDELFLESSKLPKALSKKELYSLIDKMNNDDDEQAFHKVVVHNIRLVLYQVLKRFNNVNYDKKELVSIGIMGLIKAVRSFDTSREMQFATYSAKCIDNEILMFLRILKKDDDTSGLEDTLNVDKDGNELKLEDIVPDDTDIEGEYVKNITYQIIRDTIKKLPYQDREIIMMYFGFYNNKQYKQDEIAAKLNLSQSYVSRLIKKNVKKLGRLLESDGIIGSDTFMANTDKIVKEKIKNKKEEEKDMSKKLQSIYQYFKQYTREQVDQMLTKLTREEEQLLRSRYGDDLDNPVTSADWSKEKHSKFYFNLLPKMKKLLVDPEYVSKPGRKKKTTNIPSIEAVKAETSNTSTEDVLENKTDDKVLLAVENATSDRETSTLEIMEDKEKAKEDVIRENAAASRITVDDSIQLLEFLKTPELGEMMKVLSPDKLVIVSLRLGYINGKYFSIESIAEFLKIDKQEVIDTVKTFLIEYKQSVVSMLDRSIEAAGKELTLN